MASQWHYQLFGEEFGPVSEDVIRNLMSKGTLASDDSVRRDGGSWTPIGQALNGNEVSNGAGSATAVATVQADHADDEEGWYCQVLGQELGPLSFNDLLRFAESGELSADDQIRFGDDGKWRRVGSMGRLVAVLPYQAVPSPTRPWPKLAAKAHLPAAVVPTAAATPATPSPIAPGSLTDIPEANEQTWFAWIGGVEYGPRSLLQLQQWLTSGQLSATDLVKMGRTGEWCPPATVTEILAHLAPLVSAASAPAVASAAITKPAVAASTAPAIKPSVVEVTAVKPTTAPEVKASEATVAKVEPEPVAAPAPKPAPPVTTPATSGFGGSSASSWQATPPKIPPKPVAKARSSSGGGRSLDLSFLGPLMEAKNLGIAGGAIAVAALVYALMFMPAGNGLEAKYFKELHGIYVEFQKVRESKGGDAEVQAIKSKFEKVRSPIVEALEKRANASRPASQKLLWVAKHRINEMLAQGAATRTSAEIDCEQLLFDASEMLKLPMDKPKPVESAAPKGPVNPNIDKGT